MCLKRYCEAKYLYVRVLLFFVTIEWVTRICRIIHSLGELQSYNYFCDSKIFLRRFRGHRQEVPKFLCFLLFFIRCNICCVLTIFVGVNNFVCESINYPNIKPSHPPLNLQRFTKKNEIYGKDLNYYDLKYHDFSLST